MLCVDQLPTCRPPFPPFAMACRSYAWRLPLLMLLLCPAITLGQQVDQPATQLREKLIKLQALRVEHIELSQKLAKLQEQREHITDRFTQQIKQSQNQVQTSRQKNQRQRDDLVKIQKQIQDNLQWLIGASQIALESAANIRHPVTLSDDVQAQFNDTSKALGQQSQPTNNESHESFDAITHLVQWLQTQRQQASRIDLANQQITLPDGRTHHAYVLRIGAVGEYFMLEDASMCGYRTATTWQTDLSEARQQNITKAIGIMRGQIPPALLSLPMIHAKADE